MDNYDYDILGNISDKLTCISETLEKILAEQQKANLAFENIGEEIIFKNEYVCNNLDEFDKMMLMGRSTLFLGFEKRVIKKIVKQYAESVDSRMRYIPSVCDIGEFASLVNSCEDDDFLLFNCAGISKSQELFNAITDVMGDGEISITIGKGSGARIVTLDVPKINFVFFESTCYYVPKTLRDEIDLCVWNENDRKGVSLR